MLFKEGDVFEVDGNQYQIIKGTKPDMWTYIVHRDNPFRKAGEEFLNWSSTSAINIWIIKGSYKIISSLPEPKEPIKTRIGYLLK